MGHLVVVKEFKNNPNLQIITTRFNEQTNSIEDKARSHNDVQIKNIATSIAYDQDLIIIGDSMKNLTVLTRCSLEKYRREHIQPDPEKLKRYTKDDLEAYPLNLEKYTKNDLDASVLHAFSMSRHLSYDKTDYQNKKDSQGQAFGSVQLMSDQAKKMLSILSVQADGYVRLYRLKEAKKLVVYAQINL
jgi:hypothetical protein